METLQKQNLHEILKNVFSNSEFVTFLKNNFGINDIPSQIENYLNYFDKLTNNGLGNVKPIENKTLAKMIDHTILKPETSEDDVIKVCKEAKEIMPWVETAEVKKSTNTFGAMLLPKQKALNVIREKTIKAIKNFENMKPLVFSKPIYMRMEKIERKPMPNLISKPYINIIDGRTYEVVADTVEEALLKCL